jgi:hypothetical protein
VVVWSKVARTWTTFLAARARKKSHLYEYGGDRKEEEEQEALLVFVCDDAETFSWSFFSFLQYDEFLFVDPP